MQWPHSGRAKGNTITYKGSWITELILEDFCLESRLFQKGADKFMEAKPNDDDEI